MVQNPNQTETDYLSSFVYTSGFLIALSNLLTQ